METKKDGKNIMTKIPQTAFNLLGSNPTSCTWVFSQQNIERQLMEMAISILGDSHEILVSISLAPSNKYNREKVLFNNENDGLNRDYKEHSMNDPVFAAIWIPWRSGLLTKNIKNGGLENVYIPNISPAVEELMRLYGETGPNAGKLISRRGNDYKGISISLLRFYQKMFDVTGEEHKLAYNYATARITDLRLVPIIKNNTLVGIEVVKKEHEKKGFGNMKSRKSLGI